MHFFLLFIYVRRFANNNNNICFVNVSMMIEIKQLATCSYFNNLYRFHATAPYFIFSYCPENSSFFGLTFTNCFFVTPLFTFTPL